MTPSVSLLDLVDGRRETPERIQASHLPSVDNLVIIPEEEDRPHGTQM